MTLPRLAMGAEPRPPPEGPIFTRRLGDPAVTAAERGGAEQNGARQLSVSLPGVQSAILGKYLDVAGVEVRQVPAVSGAGSDDLVTQHAASELLEEAAVDVGREAASLLALPV